MFQSVWKMKEGFALCAGLVVVGAALQWSVGPIRWQLLAFPLNFILLLLFVALLGLCYALRRKSPLFAFLLTAQAAVPTLVAAALLTIVMGLTRQVPAASPAADPLGLTKMLSFWPFVLVYFGLALIVGLIAIDRTLHFRWQRLPALLSHWGIFIAIVAATLGSADMQRLRLTANTTSPEWRATDEQGHVHELPLAIQLHKFTLDEYPPKLLLIDSKTGKSLIGKQEPLLIDKHFKSGELGEWRVRLLQYHEHAAPVMTADTTHYVAWGSSGAVTALEVEAQRMQSGQPVGQPVRGWITAGSYMFPYQELNLAPKVSLVMARREPARYASRIQVLTASQQNVLTTVEVNKPFAIEGWNIYQLSYDEAMGRWSETSTFELVGDPWLPAVYVGIYLLLAGAVLFFIFAQRWRTPSPNLPNH